MLDLEESLENLEEVAAVLDLNFVLVAEAVAVVEAVIVVEMEVEIDFDFVEVLQLNEV